MRDTQQGWLIRIIHANGARAFFFTLYIHIARGIYYRSFQLKLTWLIGVTIILITIATAFLGYVLPWGQISFWGATVITNLFSALPFVGQDIVYWLWGGFAVGAPTLTRFFSLHFLLPFLITALVAIHLLYLHETGSSNPLGLYSNHDKVAFNPYFIYKDLLGFILFYGAFCWLTLRQPWLLGDPENFIRANPLVTPLHIQPEWYFLFAYAILRSIPNKLGGVLALFASVLILYIFSIARRSKQSTIKLPEFYKIIFWILVSTLLILTWIGARPVEDPYVWIGQMWSLTYFILVLILILTAKKCLESLL